MSKCIKCGSEILTGDIHWEMGLCNNCYNELYKDHKTHISLDKMWLELAQSFRDENEKLQYKIADLEAKLAESKEICFDLQQRLADKEEQCRECKHLNKKIELNIKNKLLIENEQFKQQLAESEEENERLIKERDSANDQNKRVLEKLDIIVRSNQDLEKQLAEKEKKFQKWINAYFASPTNQPVLTTSQHITQTKIDFAIDILEELDGSSNYINSKLDFECGFYISQKTIRDKIKELRG